jgi:hypothetical protein
MDPDDAPCVLVVMRDVGRALALVLMLPTLACQRPSAALALPPAPGHVAARAHAAGLADGIPSTDVVACTAELDGAGEVHVGGQASGVFVDVDVSPRVRAYPWDHETILLAIGRARPSAWAAPEQVGTLYKIGCERPREWVELVTLEHADFAWAELSLDRRWLYFSHSGVGVLDFAAWDWATLTEPHAIASCWALEEPYPADDFVIGRIGDSALIVQSGGPCGYEAEWQGEAMVIDGIREDALPFRRKRAFVSFVVADAAGRLWVGDGGQCSAPEAVHTRGHAGLWRSDDAGERWAFVAIPGLDGRGLVGVWSHASAPEQLLARAECCYTAAADSCEGGELFASRDGGASWLEVSPRLAQADPDAYGPVERLIVDASAWTIDVHLRGDAGDLALHSADGGHTWKPSALAPAHDASVSREVDLDHWHFEPGLEGLVRIDLREPLVAPTVVLRP